MERAVPPVQADKANLWGEKLKTWRRMNNMKQAGVASLIGVSQPTVARWEQGTDQPSDMRIRQIRDLIFGSFRDEFALERLLIARQSTLRALLDLDGMRLEAISKGYRRIWPEFSNLIGTQLADHIINEFRLILDDTDLACEIHQGSVGLISGVSERHFNIDMDAAIIHQWHVCFRRHGSRTFADIVFEPCEADRSTGVTELIRFDAFGDLLLDNPQAS